ncbi:hypothetical protein XTPLMG728_0152 [Xanthomonas translucens pv. poae]|uniref:Uncharacterized protein n=1 Tax=Xanthomonas graminis pv. poae TaxID=227946 RepID=A0A0K2ZIQ1_9XANT|nr:hypothetical protein XTPLMG728_0152 [Xanthomonas translucens pv. poae]
MGQGCPGRVCRPEGVESQRGQSLRTRACAGSLEIFEKVAEPADKPGSVVDSHSSRRRVTAALERPTRTRRGQRHEVPIWSCSRWGLPYRSVTGLAVRSYRTISPLPVCLRRLRRYLSVALIRRLAPPRRYLAPCPMEPGLSSASHCTEMHRDDATVWPTPPWLLSHVRRHRAARYESICFTGSRVPGPESRAPPASFPPETLHRRRSGARGSSRGRRRPPRRWCWRGCRSRGHG